MFEIESHAVNGQELLCLCPDLDAIPTNLPLPAPGTQWFIIGDRRLQIPASAKPSIDSGLVLMLNFPDMEIRLDYPLVILFRQIGFNDSVEPQVHLARLPEDMKPYWQEGFTEFGDEIFWDTPYHGRPENLPYPESPDPDEESTNGDADATDLPEKERYAKICEWAFYSGYDTAKRIFDASPK